MIKLNLTHEIGCNETTFWSTFLDPDYNKQLFLEVLGFPEFEIVDQQESESQITRQVESRPRIPWHQSLGVKLTGRSFRFTEEGLFDKDQRVWTWDLKANIWRDKLHNRGAVRLECLGENTVRRITEIELEANICLLGRSMEKSAERRMRDGWDKSAAFMNDVWFAEVAKVS